LRKSDLVFDTEENLLIVNQMNKITLIFQKSLEEAEQMKRERSRIISSMSNIKRTVAEIQLHEEELVREVNFAFQNPSINILTK